MAALENIALMVLLMVIGASIAVSVLIGFLYYLETMDD